MKMYYETSVITRLSRRAFMDSLFFFHLIFFLFNSRLLTFEIVIKKKKKKKKKRLSWQEYIRNRKEKLLNKQSKLASAADILNWKEFQIKHISFRNSRDLRR